MTLEEAQLVCEIAKRFGLVWTITTGYSVITDDSVVSRFDTAVMILGSQAARLVFGRDTVLSYN